MHSQRSACCNVNDKLLVTPLFESPTLIFIFGLFDLMTLKVCNILANNHCGEFSCYIHSITQLVS